jgi:signal transduction histidine kinase
MSTLVAPLSFPMRAKIAFVCILMSAAVFGQSPYIDSLEIEVNKSNSDSLQIEILSELAREYMRLSTPKTLGYLETMLAIANKSNSDRGRAHYLRIAANLHSVQGYYLSAVNLAKQAIAIYQMQNDALNVANAKIAIGLIYSDQENYDSAIHFHRAAGKIFNEHRNSRRLGVSYSNMAHCFNQTGQYDSAYYYGHAGLRINSTHKNTVLTRHDTKNLGYTHLFLKQYDSALYYFERSLTIYHVENDQLFNRTLNETLYGLALTYEALGNDAKGEEYLMQSIVGGRTIDPNLWYKKSVLHRAQKLAKQGRAEEQSNYLKEYIQAMDLSTTRQRQDQFKFQEVYEKTLREAYQFELLKRERGLQEKIISKQRQQIVIFVAGLVLAGALLTGLFFLNRRYNELNKELKQKEDVLRGKTEELEKVNETKDKFFSLVAHDLRSPLASLQGFASLLAHHAGELGKEEIADVGQQLETKLGNTVALTDNLIAWARNQMQQGNAVESQPLLVKQEVEAICASLNDAALKKLIALECHVPGDVYVLADRNHLQFIVRNLLSNAIKFTPAQGKVTVHANVLPTTCQLSITDTGTGMDAETINHLFVLKRKASSKPGTEGETGTGLGLVLVHDFVTINKGTITVTSNEGKGSTFCVELPSA